MYFILIIILKKNLEPLLFSKNYIFFLFFSFLFLIILKKNFIKQFIKIKKKIFINTSYKIKKKKKADYSIQ